MDGTITGGLLALKGTKYNAQEDKKAANCIGVAPGAAETAEGISAPQVETARRKGRLKYRARRYPLRRNETEPQHCE
ncbi:MAG: hypothetical protein ACYSTL_07635, partial [Planctomycetota bacterium]